MPPTDIDILHSIVKTQTRCTVSSLQEHKKHTLIITQKERMPQPILIGIGLYKAISLYKLNQCKVQKNKRGQIRDGSLLLLNQV